jgi:uncharacterized phage-associated protein
MSTVFDTAKYILHSKGRMSTMKLQKLCYYCQAWSLVWDDAELFPEEFEAWANGPVCRELFAQTRGQFSVTEDDEPGDISNLTVDQKETIDSVLDYYYPHNAQWLSELTHLEDPWKEARGDAPVGAQSVNVISKASMAMYYGSL